MNVEFFVISLLNGVSYGLLLFMLSSGLTLIFSMMGVLNFAHASFYMLGAYFAYTLSGIVGFWPALFIAPLLVFVLGAAFERYCLRRVHKFGHVPELLVTFGLSYLILEIVQLVWGRSTVPYGLPTALQGPLFTLYGTQFPKSRSFIMLVAVLMLLSVWLLLTRTRIGLVIQAALKHPDMVEALGHNVPRVFMLVFGGGAALAGLAGVVGGNTYVTEPAMAGSVGSIIFVVVVVGGMGSLAGAFLAGMKFKSFNGDVELRKADHQLQQGLYIARWEKASAKYPYSPENTGYTLAPVKYYDAYVASTPTSCQMKRPS